MEEKKLNVVGEMDQDPQAQEADNETAASAEDEDTSKDESAKANPEKKKRKRRPPLVPWKKPKDMPRRPLSAYNIFFKEQREMLMKSAAAAAALEQPEAAASGKSTRKKRSNKSVGIGFANLARKIASDWKNLAPEAKAPYEKIAGAEKDRYKKEMLVWRAKQKELKDRTMEADQNGSVSGDSELMNVEGSDSVDADHEENFDRLSPLPPSRRSLNSSNSQMNIPLVNLDGNHNGSNFAFNAVNQGFHNSLTNLRGSSSGWSDPGPMHQGMGQDMMDFGHSSINRIDTFPISHNARIALGHGTAAPARDQAFAQQPFNTMAGMTFGMSTNMDPPAEVNVFNLEQQLHIQQVQLQQQQQQQQHHHQPFGRRNTWSGTNNETQFQQAMRRDSNSQLGERLSQNTSSMAASSFPESWFEADEPSQPRPPVSSPSDGVSKRYPDNWFEVNNSNNSPMNQDANDESLRYSPEGDITGKVSPGRSSEAAPSMPPLKSGGESKVSSDCETKMTDNTPLPFGPRPLETLTSGTAAQRRRQCEGRFQQQLDNPVVQNSLQHLGLQLDDATVDFLTGLRFSAHSDHSRND